MNLREEAEFNNIRDFLNKNYSIDVDLENEKPGSLMDMAVKLFLSLNTWENYIYHAEIMDDSMKSMFKECISNTLHIIVFSALKMRLPLLMMINRTLELMALFFFDSKVNPKFLESDLVFENIEYRRILIDRYEFERKYDVDLEKAVMFCDDMMHRCNVQYRELSNHLSFKNSQYYSNEKCLDVMNWTNLDVIYISNQISLMSSIINSLMILLHFEIYIETIPELDKLFIRNAINNNLKINDDKKYDFKNKIIDIFGEI